ncbi:MAG: DUF1553 domain-containing protein [Verrucomicrobia bacterium]|nr:DUF1553 domain-containing protein [Verrucomicrobiota bacterium]
MEMIKEAGNICHSGSARAWHRAMRCGASNPKNRRKSPLFNGFSPVNVSFMRIGYSLSLAGSQAVVNHPSAGLKASQSRSSRGFSLLVLCCLAAAGVGGVVRAETELSSVRFEEHIRPLFKAMCFHCHGEEKEKKGDLDLRLVRLMKAGGKSGSVLTPGDAHGSLLWRKINSDKMPEGPKKLTPQQKTLVRQWIEQGALTTDPEPADVADARFSAMELKHWAFQPVIRPQVPQVEGYALATPVDAFIARRLADRALPFSPTADRATLIRRVTFDLTGLPPTPEAVQAFKQDEAPNAYERLVDRILASPQFGVRWGRHWLDTAGFAESEGGVESDPKRPHAWRFRDYVIDSFNANKPIDAFFREQLAGDELAPPNPPDPGNARQIELLTASGFVRMAPDPTQANDTLDNRNAAAADSIKVVSTAMLGLTVGCAQCHDHKYDPITIDDYYAFRAIFDPLFPLKGNDWRRPSERLIDVTPADLRAKAERIEAEAKVVEDEINARKLVLGREILAKKLADVPEKRRDEVRLANEAAEKDRNEQQRKLLEDFPMVKSPQFIAGFLVEYDNAAHRKFEKESEKVAAIRATKPPKHLLMVADEKPGIEPVSAVLFRGDPASPGEKVAPSELAVLRRRPPLASVPSKDPNRPTTGRRLAYAQHLTSGTHPLTARAFVNRVWLHHFGRGLVATPNDFGLNGDRPSHPELLDWLADEFVRHGWDQKRLHRLILLSTAYQQQSRRTPRLDAIDPQNELVGRMNVRRMEAEAIRDAVLAVSEKLNPTLGGPSVPVTVNGEGKAVLGEQKFRDGLVTGVQDANNANAFRRSIFVEVQRSLPLNMLLTFDQPEMNPNCDLRRHSTVTTQSLWFLNDEFLVQAADDLARFILDSGADRESQLRSLYQRLFASKPSLQELGSLIDFLDQQSDYYRLNPDPEFEKRVGPDGKGKAPALRALSALCQTLLASNRFLYID